MSRPILIASTNPHKLDELRRMLRPAGFEILAPDDLEIRLHVEETGETFVENARLKAEAYSRAGGILTLADDSGLMVDALNGEPGVRSARFAGPNASDAERIDLLLRRMRGVPQPLRTAHFVAAIALAPVGGQVRVVEGRVDGRVTEAPRGDRGFGYDPIFLYPPLDQTFGEMSSETKAGISHRGRALRSALDILMSIPCAGILEQSSVEGDSS